MSVTLTRLQQRATIDASPNDGAPDAGQSMPQAEKTPGEIMREMDKEELLRRFIEWYKSSRDHYQEARMEYLECYDFAAGWQWSDEDKMILADQGRPAVTFNRIGPFVDGVSGLEIGNRQTTQYLPRTLGKSGVNELLTGTAQWVRDECDADDEESESFRDAIVCGLGVTQTRMDYDDEPDGMIKIDRVDPIEMFLDPSSRKPNYADSRYVMRLKDVPVTTAEEMFPDVPTADLHAKWAEDQPEAERQPHNARLAPYYRIDQAGEIDRQRMQCRLVEVEWWDYVTAWRVLDPQTGRFIRLGEKEAGLYRMRARMLGLQTKTIKDRQRRYYKAIVGNVVLRVMRGADEGGFTYKFITGKRDRNRGHWYGVVRAMRDPQQWANKFMSQSLHIVNTNAKGGLLAETDAFVDIEEARDSWADADSIIELNPGGLNKVKQKDVPQFPAQINQMMANALDAIPATAGINLEMIAQQTNDQAGVLEMQRKQQGMTVLAYLFNAKRRYQKEQGRLMLWMIQTFIADGRLVRIGGPDEAQYVPLIHAPGLAEYDVVVDDAPTSPNMKERVWAMIMQMFPVLRTMQLPPQAIVELMKYAPFPTTLTQKLQEMMAQPQQNPAMQSAAQLNQAKAQQAESAAQLNQARAQHTQAQAQHIGAQVQHLATETALLPGQAQSEIDERQARIGLASAQAVNQLQNAGLAPDQALHDAAMQRAQFEHERGMDHAGHALELARHALDVHQAMSPPAPANGGAQPQGQP